MTPEPRDGAIVRDAFGELWSDVTGKWLCRTHRGFAVLDWSDLVEQRGPLDVHVWRGRAQ